MSFDVLIVGGGPAGLAAALLLGRARKRVLLCDAGPRRNAAASHVQGFVTRDGIPPDQFRRIAREQLAAYPGVAVRDVAVVAIERSAAGFAITLEDERVTVRRVILATGMVDDVPDLPGLRSLWGTSVVQCPYCHGWEVRDQRFGYLAAKADAVEWALLLRGWTDDVMVFTGGRFPVPEDTRIRLAAARIGIEERPIAGVHSQSGTDATPRLAHIELADGTRVPRDVLFAHPPQRQTALVASLGLTVDDRGYVSIDEHAATSVPGLHAAGDLTTGYQSATLAAAAGFRAGASVNHALTIEDAMAATSRVMGVSG